MSDIIILRLVEEIKEKQDLLESYIKKYHWGRLIKLVFSSEDDKNLYLNTIEKMNFSFSNVFFLNNENNNNWKITYTHKTKHYNTSNYCLNSSSEDNLRRRNVDGLKVTKISFGYEDETYFIKTKNKEIKVYMYESLPTTYNLDYEYEIGIFGEDVDFLMKKYAYNYNIPEWLAISCFLKIRKKNMSPDDIYEYFTNFP